MGRSIALAKMASMVMVLNAKVYIVNDLNLNAMLQYY